MDIDGYKAHRNILNELMKKYRNRTTYPLGIHSENAELLDREEYWSSLHYVYLFHLQKAIRSKNEPKSQRFRKKVRQVMVKLNECESMLGFLAPKNHGLEHVTEICGLN